MAHLRVTSLPCFSFFLSLFLGAEGLILLGLNCFTSSRGSNNPLSSNTFEASFPFFTYFHVFHSSFSFSYFSFSCFSGQMCFFFLLFLCIYSFQPLYYGLALRHLLGRKHDSTRQSGVEAPRPLKRSLPRLYSQECVSTTRSHATSVTETY